MFQRRTVRWSAVAAAAAAIVLAVGLWSSKGGRNQGNGIAWAEVVKTLEAATNIHIVQTGMAKGQEFCWETWVRKPNGYRADSPELSVIDDGKTRLTIDKKARTAQWFESPMPYGAKDGEGIWSMVDAGPMVSAFKQGLDPKIRMTKDVKECTETRLAYVFTNEKSEQLARLWIRADSMLVERMEYSDLLSASLFSASRVRMTFSYEPIPDSVFAMSVPAGFKELPRPERRSVSGHVVDPNGAAMVGATVDLVSAWGYFAKETRTDARGEFTIELPPKGAPSDRLNLPLVLRAFRPDDPSSVAWTMLRSPDDHDQLGGTIPGDPGKIEIERTTGEAKCADATGIVLKMGPATYLAGQVTDTTGKPILGAAVQVEAFLTGGLGGGSYVRLGGSDSGGETIALTDDQGRYRLTHLPILWKPSCLCLRCSAPGYGSRDRRLEIGEKWSKDAVDFQLFQANWTVSGRLVDDHGTIIKHRSVGVLVSGESVPSCHTQTDENGRFRLVNCPGTPGLQVKVELSGDPPPLSPGQVIDDPWYYLDVIKDIVPVPGQTHYEVELVAQRPAITLEIRVRNSAGEVIPYFPVEVRGKRIPHGWSWSKFLVRTDAKGCCTFKDVPRADGLHLRLDSTMQVYNPKTRTFDEKLSNEVWRIAESHKKRYDSIIDLPVNLSPDKTSYAVDATVLTRDEQKRKPR